MTKIILSAAVLFLSIAAAAQERVLTKTGKISFYSKTPMEDIEAHNKNAVSVLDKTTGQLEFSVLMKGFEFRKALMQEHFNENYVESDKFPKATFKGKITDLSKINFSKNGTYTVPVTGNLTIHGETNEITTNAVITVQDGVLNSSAEFSVRPEEYKISIPGLVREKISKSLRITVNATYTAGS